jgi:hypothetical protein
MLLQDHIVHSKYFYVPKVIINLLIFGQLDVSLLNLLEGQYFLKEKIV